MKASLRNSSYQSGLTLIELMIAMVISALIISSVLQLYLSAKSTDRLTAAISRLQESSRVAIKLIADDIQMAGYQGCADPRRYPANIIAQNLPISSFYDGSLLGWEVSPSSWSGPHGTQSAISGSDVIRIIHASAKVAAVVDSMSGTNDGVTVEGGDVIFENGDLAFISDCENTDLFEITNNPKEQSGNVMLEHQNKSGANKTNHLSVAYTKENSQAMKYVSHTYFVGNTNRTDKQGNALYALYRVNANGETHEVVEGVENIQAVYGEILNNGNVRFGSANDVSDWGRVSIVKLSLLISSYATLSENDDQTYVVVGGVIKPQASNSSATGSHYISNKRIRKVFTTTIKINNRVNLNV